MKKKKECKLEDKKERTEKCAKEIDEVLKKHGCVMDVAVTVSTNGNTPHIKIRAK